jgi:Zn-dependent protease
MNFWLKVLTYSLPAGRVLGIPLRINWLLLVFIPILIRPFLQFTVAGVSPAYALLLGIMFVMLLYTSVLLHELGHAWGTRLVGNTIREIQLTPIGGVAIGEGRNASPRAELIVIGLGPAVSVLLVLVGWGLGHVVERIDATPLFLRAAVTWLFSINLMLALFNLLVPIFPLDSAKIVRAALSLRLNPQRVTYYLAQGGIGLAILILIAGIAGVPLPFIGAGSSFLLLIMIIGIQACFYVLRDVEYNQVYDSYDQWGQKPVYYDSDLMSRTKSRAGDDLRSLMPTRWGKPRRRPRAPAPVPRFRNMETVGYERKGRTKPAGPARVLDAHPEPDKIDDPAEVRALMRAAAEREDFETAARLKKRLKELTGFER